MKFIKTTLLATTILTSSFAFAEKQDLTLYIVRHGQTIFNLMDKVQGISDGILTKKGIEGAVNMGKGLKDVKFANVYSSDLQRAAETARLALEQNVATENWVVIQKPELRENSFGIWEGDYNCAMYKAMSADFGITVPNEANDIVACAGALMQEKFGGDFIKFMEGLADWNKKIDTKYQISESAVEIYARLQKGVDEIISENQEGGNVMVVGHGQSINALFKVLKVDTAGSPLKNSSVTKVIYKNGSFILDGKVGDMSYLENGAKQ